MAEQNEELQQSTSATSVEGAVGPKNGPKVRPYIRNLDEYKRLYRESIAYPDVFWGRVARELLTWDHDFHTVQTGISLTTGQVAWFLGGKLNACFNCVDRHALQTPDKIAVIDETDDSVGGTSITYEQLLTQTSQLAWTLREDLGVRRGDIVAVYMPMIPATLVAMLACARIGAVHAVVFAGFSAEALRDRLVDAKASVLLTVDESRRGGKVLGIKKIVDTALDHEDVQHVRTLVYQRTGNDSVPFTPGRDLWWGEETAKWPGYLPPEPMDAEDPLFLLYTSGSTGKPKGILHTTGGFLVGAAATAKHVFNLHADGDDRFFCGCDIGWITGHTYVVYGPLLLGTATVVYEGTPLFPHKERYWDIVQEHRVTQLYIAPTAVRVLKRAGSTPADHNTSSLRVLGSVGEPIAPDLWQWYFEHVGKGQCEVVDTYWQTETGSHVLTPLAGVTPTKPGSATLPFFGINAVLIDPVSGAEVHGSDVEGVLAFKGAWPSMARTVWRDHRRFLQTYLQPYPGGYYFSGDGAFRDADGYYWIRGRVDDVINVSGHRLSTSEIEAVMAAHDAVAESAAVGVADDLTGQAVVAFVALKGHGDDGDGDGDGDKVHHDLVQHVRGSIGPFAAPKSIFVVAELPKTRSGKIMRRVLRKVVLGQQDELGDTTTMADPSVIGKLVEVVHRKQ